MRIPRATTSRRNHISHGRIHGKVHHTKENPATPASRTPARLAGPGRTPVGPETSPDVPVIACKALWTRGPCGDTPGRFRVFGSKSPACLHTCRLSFNKESRGDFRAVSKISGITLKNTPPMCLADDLEWIDPEPAENEIQPEEKEPWPSQGAGQPGNRSGSDLPVLVVRGVRCQPGREHHPHRVSLHPGGGHHHPLNRTEPGQSRRDRGGNPDDFVLAPYIGR